jgi:hypothetical protein
MAPLSCESCPAQQECVDTSCLVQNHLQAQAEFNLPCDRCSDTQFWECVSFGVACASNVEPEATSSPGNRHKLRSALLVVSVATLAFMFYQFEVRSHVQAFAADDPVYQQHISELTTTQKATPDINVIPREFLRRDRGLAELFYNFPIGVRYGAQIVKWVKPYPHVNANLLAAIGLAESCGNPNAHRWDSRHDKGLFQINETAWPGVDYFNPSANARKALEILEEYMSLYEGNPDAVAIAAAVYNGGPPGALWKSKQISWETLVDRVGLDKANIITRYTGLVTGIYAEAQAGASFSQTAYDATESKGFYSPNSMCAAAASDAGWIWPFPDNWVKAGRK